MHDMTPQTLVHHAAYFPPHLSARLRAEAKALRCSVSSLIVNAVERDYTARGASAMAEATAPADIPDDDTGPY